MTGELLQVDFHGDALWAMRQGDQVFVAIKPICEALGLQWEGQHKRLRRDAVLSEGMSMMDIPSAGGNQETVCLPLDMLNGWLFGVDVSRIKREEVKQKVLAYKRECYAVLHAHFMPQKRRADVRIVPVRDCGQGFDMPVAAMNAQVRLVATAQSVYGRRAARHLWENSNLPQVAEVADSEKYADPGGCLAHLLRFAVAKHDTVVDLIETVQCNGGGSDLLGEIGVRVCPPGYPHSIAVAESTAALGMIYGETAWADGGWKVGLLGLEGARVAVGVPFAGTERRAVIVPMAHVNGTKRFEEPRRLAVG